MARNHFQPKGGRYGTMPEILTGRQLDAGLTPNTTTRIAVATSIRKAILARLSVTTTVPVGGRHHHSSPSEEVQSGVGRDDRLTAAFDLTGSHRSAGHRHPASVNTHRAAAHGAGRRDHHR
jgi:hypothetical protein